MTETKLDRLKLAQDVVRALAAHDPLSGWVVETKDHLVKIRRPDGAAFSVHHDDGWAPRTRVLFSPDWPQGEGGEYYKPYAGKWDITVAETRPVAEIAREVARRLLPVYLPAYVEALGKKDADDAARKLRRERADLVAARFKTEARHERDASTVRVYEPADFEATTFDGKTWQVKLDLADPAMEALVGLLLADALPKAMP